jgi:hypothetical protein
MPRPMPFRWDGAVMIPEPKFVTLARKQFAHGQRYILEGHEPASHADRGHYFASIKDAWDNLDEDATARYPSPEHLRKWALVKAGWRKENFTVCDSEDRATQLAAFIRRLDEYCVVVVEGAVVRTYVARSQKIGRPEDGLMTKEEWRQSKQDVLDILSQKIGVTRRELERASR